MDALSEEYAWRAMELRYDDTLGTVDDKSTLVGHIGNCAEVHILYFGGKVFMIGVGAIEFELSLERDTIGEATVKTFVDGVTRRINEIVKEFENKVVARIGNGEVLRKYLIESFVFSFLSWSI
jgi:hypothetical protein